MSSPVPGAYASVQDDDRRFYADKTETLDLVLAVELVAQLPAAAVSSQVQLQYLRNALREQRWADALVGWIEETGKGVDVYGEPPKVWDPTSNVWTSDEISLAIVEERLPRTPLFVPLPESDTQKPL
jgi:hypothetical protein